MTPFQRMDTLVQFNLSEVVPSKGLDMSLYVGRATAYNCMTSGCRAGWGTQCPALQEEGFRLERYNLDSSFHMSINGAETGHGDAKFLEFFGITGRESNAIFGSTNDGTKAELRATWKQYCENHPELVAAERHAIPCPTPSFLNRAEQERALWDEYGVRSEG